MSEKSQRIIDPSGSRVSIRARASLGASRSTVTYRAYPFHPVRAQRRIALRASGLSGAGHKVFS